MTHFYFFTSTISKDEISCLSIVTTSEAKAYALANRHFTQQGYRGVPQRLAI